jgi:exopolysaccharide production protein ExoQ
MESGKAPKSRSEFQVQTISSIATLDQTASRPLRLIRVEKPAPVWHLPLSWLILVPLYFFAANESFIPTATDEAFAATGASPNSHASGSHMISVAIVFLICSILIATRSPRFLSYFTRRKALLALPVLAIISSLWSSDASQSFVSGMILAVFTIFALYVGDRFSFQEQIELIMMAGAIALPLSVVLAVLMPSVYAPSNGWSGIFGQKQTCAVAAILWLITALHWKTSGLYQNSCRVICMLLSVLLLVMSRSRTGWALAGIALLLSAALWAMRKMPATESLLLILLGLGIAAGIGYLAYSHLTTVVTSVGKDSTLSQRTIIWAAVWPEIMKRPILGFGFNAFWKGLYGPSQDVVMASGWNVFQAQDGFLDVWLAVGIVGVALIVVMLFEAAKNAVRSFHSEHSAFVRWCIVMIVCTLLYNIGESTIGHIQIIWFVFLLAYAGLNEIATTERNLILHRHSLSHS